MRLLARATLACALLAAILAGMPSRSASPGGTAAAFTEVRWPFLMDQWGLGRAFRCDAETCGVEVQLFVRAKIGFCNCTTGVSDDDELERVGDMELLGPDFKAPAPGHPITVAWMKGRGRVYDVAGHSAGTTLALAFNDHCDVIGATALAPDGPAARVEPAVLGFLNSEEVVRWAEKVLGL
jgi:hypothetical protein